MTHSCTCRRDMSLSLDKLSPLYPAETSDFVPTVHAPCRQVFLQQTQSQPQPLEWSRLSWVWHRGGRAGSPQVIDTKPFGTSSRLRDDPFGASRNTLNMARAWPGTQRPIRTHSRLRHSLLGSAHNVSRETIAHDIALTRSHSPARRTRIMLFRPDPVPTDGSVAFSVRADQRA